MISLTYTQKVCITLCKSEILHIPNDVYGIPYNETNKYVIISLY